MGISVDGVWERHGIFRTLSGMGAFWVTFIRLFSWGIQFLGGGFKLFFIFIPIWGR